MTTPYVDGDLTDLEVNVDPIDVTPESIDESDLFYAPPGECNAGPQDGDNDAEVGDE